MSNPTGKNGRESELTDALIGKIVEVIGRGGFFETACARLGISYDTGKKWKGVGRKVRSGEISDPTEHQSRCLRLLSAIEVAEATVEMLAVERIVMSGETEDLKWWLTRRHNKRWNNNHNAKIDLTMRYGDDADPRKVLSEKLAALVASSDPPALPEGEPES